MRGRARSVVTRWFEPRSDPDSQATVSMSKICRRSQRSPQRNSRASEDITSDGRTRRKSCTNASLDDQDLARTAGQLVLTSSKTELAAKLPLERQLRGETGLNLP